MTKSTGGLCVDKDFEPVLRGAISVMISPVIFVYKLLVLTIIYILIMSVQPPQEESQAAYLLPAGRLLRKQLSQACGATELK